jgi:group I intron endonuclease
MSLIKRDDYFADVKFIVNPISLFSLKRKAGIYMITNKDTKKVYIGMSADLYTRLSSYLDINRLMNNRSSRINRALLKYGFNKFSVTILEVDNSKIKGKQEISAHLRKR